MRGRRRWIAGTALLVLVAVSCTDWQVWDALFDRRPPADTMSWTGGDGAISIPLGAPGRVLWVFGDSYITEYDPATKRRVFKGNIDDPDDWQVLLNIVFGTTIAIQEGADQETPDPADMFFYARLNDPSDGVVGLNGLWSGFNFSFRAFFSRQMLGLDPEGLFLWPQGGHCVNCSATGGTLLMNFAELAKCDPNPASGPDLNCFPLCKAGDADECHDGVEIIENYLAEIANVHQGPEHWTTTAIHALGKDVGWGNSYVQIGSYTYIYGARRLEGVPIDVVVARAPNGQIKNPASWRYRTAGTLPTGCTSSKTLNAWVSAPIDDTCVLHEVADRVDPLFTVHQVQRGSTTRYVLVHTRPGDDNYMHVRTSTSQLGFGDVSGETPRIDLASIEDSLAGEIYLRAISGACQPEPVGNQDLYPRCAVTYHGRGHSHLSYYEQGNDMSALLYGFIVPHGPPGHIEDAEYYRPRFGLIPIENLPGFCSAGNCWGGVARQYATRTLDGVFPRIYPFDVRQARGTTLKAEITGGIGDPTLAVGFHPTQPSGACSCSDPAGAFVTCSCQVPADAQSAAVWVSGDAGDQFSLRVLHQENDLGWTPWFDRDDPNASGDHEGLSTLRSEGKRICPAPSAVQCRVKSTDPAEQEDWSRTGQTLTCTPQAGLTCLNSQNSGGCLDYQVRFHCAPGAWLDRDDPSGGGDSETLSNFLAEGKACDRPVHVECRRKSDKVDHRATGQRVRCEPAHGFSCTTADNPSGCSDYEVRFYCGG